MAKPKQSSCPMCEKLVQELSEQKARIEELEAKLASATKHSGNSSKPPSSDIVNPPKPGSSGRSKKRKRGGQVGHKRHERPAFPPEEVDRAWEYFLESCPDCGHSLQPGDGEPRVIQQVAIIERPTFVEEHRSVAYWCPCCGKQHYAPFPEGLVKAGLVGPRLTALVAYLKGPCHASFSTIRKFFRDVVGFRISRGQLSKLVQKVSVSLADPYEQLLALLPQEAILNVDETGHKDQGRRFWTWCFRAAQYTVYKIDPSRGSNVLIEVLGKEFQGVLGCDYFSAYRKYMRLNENVLVQFCLAHLIRDVKFMATHPDPRNREHGERLTKDLRHLFRVIHRQETYKSEDHFQDALYRACSNLMWDVTEEFTDTRESRNMATRFFRDATSYFQFLVTPGVEPTNNLAEQAIRFVAIHRRMTQGTRGLAGQRWCERIFTATTTCQQQGRSVFNFLCDAINAYFGNNSVPSLVPDTS